MENCVEKPYRLATTVKTRYNIFVQWFGQDYKLTNDGGSAIGLAEAAILKKSRLKHLIMV